MIEENTQALVRKMLPEDVEAVAKIEKSIFSDPWSAGGFLDALNMEEANYLVIEQDKEIIGYCGYYSSYGEAEITNVAISANARNKGYATMMLTELIRQCRNNGNTRIVLEVRYSNASAIHLYERLGFISVGIRKGFYSKPQEDAIIMVIE